ncbi:TetR/AcrR family transcriptional regulator [Glutamicibacter sp. MNS18]|uniref:TetR/AcrR family transcriptional regulator n=1 Tax=Glutamicibacter sp. MNS18 TaxID=2989817 RepID=UPI0022358F38|nr:TetR/AcrR family transcriptional regulator [Glutamicibacter sp. MNS18]MCW4465089.1 TetR/AcrR family transcriptional regulator [Glutamicibacter sp. MNS18]
MQKTRLSLTRTARQLTAEHGFSGFTIEELCARVGISRRTFFNYFPTKMDAVFGHDSDALPDGAIERFMAARPAGITGLSPTLLADLVTLVLEQLDMDEQAILSTHGFFQAVHRDPELLKRMMELVPQREAEFRKLVATREQVAEDHPGLAMMGHTIHFATITAVDRYLANPDKCSLGEEFLNVMEQAQQLLAQPLRRH